MTAATRVPISVDDLYRFNRLLCDHQIVVVNPIST